jgi:hypothetical protein
MLMASLFAKVCLKQGSCAADRAEGRHGLQAGLLVLATLFALLKWGLCCNARG